MLEFTAVSRQRLDQAASHSAPHLRPLMRAVRDGVCAFGLVTPGKPFDLPKSKPRIVIVTDDLDQAVGPDGFHRKSMRRLIRDSDAIVIVSSAPMVHVYAGAVRFTAESRLNSLIVETRLSHEQHWLELIMAENPSARLMLSTVQPAGRA